MVRRFYKGAFSFTFIKYMEDIVKKTLIYIVVPCLALFLNGCSSTPELDLIKMDSDHSIENSKLANYLANGAESISYSYKEDDDKYEINVKAKVNSAFYDNNPLGILNILSRTVQDIDSDISDYCGRKDCDFGTLKVVSATSTNQDPYSMKIDSHDRDEVLVYGEVKYKRDDLTYYKGPDYNENEDVLSFEDAVYEYMENKFNQMTNAGQNYIPEVDDPKVLKAAALQFDIAEKEASDIYISKAVQHGETYMMVNE